MKQQNTQGAAGVSSGKQVLIRLIGLLVGITALTVIAKMLLE